MTPTTERPTRCRGQRDVDGGVVEGPDDGEVDAVADPVEPVADRLVDRRALDGASRTVGGG